MSKIGKYLLLTLLIANICSQYVPLAPVSNLIFYSTLGLGVLYSILYCLHFRNIENISSTSFLWLFIIVFVLYQCTFGLNYIGQESITYILAKVTVLLIIYWGIVSNYEFYYMKIVLFFCIIIPVLIIYGYLFHNEIFQGRMTCGFGNPNSTSAISSIGFAGCLLLEYKPRWLRIVGATVCFFGVLAGGSRATTTVCILALFLKYGISIRTVLLAVVCLVAIIEIFPYFGFDLVGLDRALGAFSNHDFVGSRGDVRRATLMMINENPIIGWGFKSGIQGEAARITTMGSHNGYLDIIKAIGYPFAIILFTGAFLILFKLRWAIKSDDPFIRFHLFIVVSLLLTALYESYIIGVNQIMTNMFFVSTVILQYYPYHKLDYESGED